jgi:ABC-2 type transport system permease protein
LSFTPGFANNLRKGQEAPLQVLVDGTNSNTALIALGYINTIASGFAQDYAVDLMRRVRGVKANNNLIHVTIAQRPWYNPDFTAIELIELGEALGFDPAAAIRRVAKAR